ncbi:hypothetical protein [Roseovarius sp. D22-M7]|uniref:hypothetical protein n=1 Tax=Roseovarius sp. D22-M7 TaxID=3127116 RepID=UPI0030100B7A
MSDPASNSDSEAVLASIRRLVLDGKADSIAPHNDAPAAPLVLTAAQRVDAGDADPALDWQDAAAPDATEAPAASVPPDLPDARPASDLTDLVVDEDFLRDIVSEIVREELQGDMGERITRNVRKLVRREIHRALASRDFD